MKVEYTREQAKQVIKDFNDYGYKRNRAPVVISREIIKDFLNNKFKSEIKEGTWVMEKDGSIQTTLFVTKVQSSLFRAYGLFDLDWLDLEHNISDSWKIDSFQPAPDHIVIKRMTAEVNKRYSEGDEIGNPGDFLGDFVESKIKRIDIDEEDLIEEGIICLKSGSMLMKDGKWATKIEQTYSIGDRFEKGGETFILAQVNGEDKVQLTCIDDGITWSDAFEVNSLSKITQAEFKVISDNYKFKQINK